ncbi:DUF1289 domain-containing protein [Methylomarinum sp. Ch1-1]|uniref:DUF1289 domain-containing protein n=1 Tax=Methylomarinum roseum TaxID=3067653 RepID=A0AAU7NTX8_9GAMM
MIDELPELEMVESPCVGRCCLNEEDVCLGCYRSLEEISNWTLVDNEVRRRYLENIVQRKARNLAE